MMIFFRQKYAWLYVHQPDIKYSVYVWQLFCMKANIISGIKAGIYLHSPFKKLRDVLYSLLHNRLLCKNAVLNHLYCDRFLCLKFTPLCFLLNWRAILYKKAILWMLCFAKVQQHETCLIFCNLILFRDKMSF